MVEEPVRPNGQWSVEDVWKLGVHHSSIQEVFFSVVQVEYKCAFWSMRREMLGQRDERRDAHSVIGCA
jgi:hypothetical protein